MEIGITREAAAYVGERGSRLYLWQEPIGRAWAADRLSFDDPNCGLPFRSFRVGEVTILVGEDVEPPQTLYVSLRRVRLGLRIEWDGRTWGWRGDSEGGGG
jgi:hypothetical protein